MSLDATALDGGWPRIRAMAHLDTLTASDFEELRGQLFRIADGFVAELVEVTEIPGESGGRAPFSLVFEGGPSQPLPQAVYPVHHERLGSMEIFLVPIASNRYEAVFA
jgi:hypothetical protein